MQECDEAMTNEVAILEKCLQTSKLACERNRIACYRLSHNASSVSVERKEFKSRLEAMEYRLAQQAESFESKLSHMSSRLDAAKIERDVLAHRLHEFRATAVTRMYEKGVPEKIIADKSGHKSMKALRSYEHTSFMQEKAAGECIQHGKQYEPLVATETPPALSTACSSTAEIPSVALSKACNSTTGMPPVVPSTPLPQQQIPPKMAFSGLNNCTFNFYKM